MTQNRRKGKFYTVGNPFTGRVFRNFAIENHFPYYTVLEPFAGANHLIRHLRDLELCNKSVSYDIDPGHDDVVQRDTINDFPFRSKSRGGNMKRWEVCVTNPPWLAKNSYKRQGFNIECSWKWHGKDDIYKVCLDLCLERCKAIAIILPASFAKYKYIDHPRLQHYILMKDDLFDETKNPSALCLFTKMKNDDTLMWHGDEYIGSLKSLRELYMPKPVRDHRMRFNALDGNVGLYALDNTRGRSVRFCKPEEIENYEGKPTSRHITKIAFEGEPQIDKWNEAIEKMRDGTDDVFMAPFKGRMTQGKHKGMYRRRLDYTMARDIMNS